MNALELQFLAAVSGAEGRRGWLFEDEAPWLSRVTTLVGLSVAPGPPVQLVLPLRAGQLRLRPLR